MWGLKLECLASGAHRRLHSPLAHHSRQALAWYYPGLCKRTVSGVWKPVEIPPKKSRETIIQRTWRTTQCIHRSVNHSGSKTYPGKHPTGGHVSHPTAVHYIYVTLGSYRYITISDYIIRLKCQWYCMNASTHHRGKLTILAVFIYLKDTSIAATHRFFIIHHDTEQLCCSFGVFLSMIKQQKLYMSFNAHFNIHIQRIIQLA